MTYLADACAIVAYFGEEAPSSVMPKGAAIMRRESIGVLPTTIWEISEKAGRGRLPNFWGPETSLSAVLRGLRFELHVVEWEDGELAAKLPNHRRDPMDRLLIAAALRTDQTVITSDRIFTRYNVRTVW